MDLYCDLVCKGPLVSQGMAPMFPAFNSGASCLPLSFPQHSGPQGKMKTEGTGENNDPFLYISLRPHGPCILPSLSYSFLSTLNPLPGMSLMSSPRSHPSHPSRCGSILPPPPPFPTTESSGTSFSPLSS